MAYASSKVVCSPQRDATSLHTRFWPLVFNLLLHVTLVASSSQMDLTKSMMQQPLLDFFETKIGRKVYVQSKLNCSLQLVVV